MIQYKITQHTENQENLKQLADIKNKMTEMLKLSDKDFNITTIKMFQQVRTSKDKHVGNQQKDAIFIYQKIGDIKN